MMDADASGPLRADPGVVHDLHRQLLKLLSEAERRYGPLGLRLEGGTALAAYYLSHRQSEDLDVFGNPDMDARDFGRAVGELIEKAGMAITVSGSSNRGFAEYLVQDPAGGSGTIRLQLLHGSPFSLEPARRTVEGLAVGSFRDVAAGKAHAICDRYEPRDFIDLHAILQRTSVGRQAPTESDVRVRFHSLAGDLMAIEPGLTPARFGIELAKAQGRTVVSEFPLRLLRPVTDAEIAATVELCIDEVAHMVRDVVR